MANANHAALIVRRRFAVAVVVAAILVTEYLNFTGFCWGDLQGYSDLDFIGTAVQSNVKFQKANGSRDKIYTSLDDFFAQNPACCRLYRWGHISVGDFRFLGVYRAVAEIWYQAKTTGASQFYQSEVVLDACRRVRRRRGIEVERPASRQVRGSGDIATDYPASGGGAETP